MTQNFLSSFFGKTKQKQEKREPLLEEIYSLKKHTNLTIYDSVDIFLHKRNYHIPLLIYDAYRGLYLFEVKEWSYDELKDATITQTQKAPHAQNTLSYSSMQEGISRKLDEVIHTSDIPIHNYLLMTNLSSHEYQNLDASLKERLPQEKIIFANMGADAILKKLQQEQESQLSYGSAEKIVGSLLTQYTLLSQNNELFLANEEQKAFIDAELPKFSTLNAAPKSGLSTTLILKVIFEILKNPTLKAVIIKPTTLSKDILHRTFLEIIEHGIIEFDILSLEILTPSEAKSKLAKKHSALANMVFCDDTSLLSEEFINAFKSSQRKATLLLGDAAAQNPTFTFSRSYLLQEKEVHFYETNPHAKALQLCAGLLKTKEPNDIIIVANSLNRDKLLDDLQSFIKDEAKIVNSSIGLAFQELDGLKLATYKDLLDVPFQDAILLDIEDASEQELEYCIDHADSSVHILYEDETKNIQQLKEKYESK